MVKHTQTIRRQLADNCLSVFDHFVKLALKELKKRLWRMCLPVNFVKFLRTLFVTEHLRWLLLLVANNQCTEKFYKSNDLISKYRGGSVLNLQKSMSCRDGIKQWEDDIKFSKS